MSQSGELFLQDQLFLFTDSEVPQDLYSTGSSRRSVGPQWGVGGVEETMVDLRIFPPLSGHTGND